MHDALDMVICDLVVLVSTVDVSGLHVQVDECVKALASPERGPFHLLEGRPAHFFDHSVLPGLKDLPLFVRHGFLQDLGDAGNSCTVGVFGRLTGVSDRLYQGRGVFQSRFRQVDHRVDRGAEGRGVVQPRGSIGANITAASASFGLHVRCSFGDRLCAEEKKRQLSSGHKLRSLSILYKLGATLALSLAM